MICKQWIKDPKHTRKIGYKDFDANVNCTCISSLHCCLCLVFICLVQKDQTTHKEEHQMSETKAKGSCSKNTGKTENLNPVLNCPSTWFVSRLFVKVALLK